MDSQHRDPEYMNTPLPTKVDYKQDAEFLAAMMQGKRQTPGGTGNDDSIGLWSYQDEQVDLGYLVRSDGRLGISSTEKFDLGRALKNLYVNGGEESSGESRSGSPNDEMGDDETSDEEMGDAETSDDETSDEEMSDDEESNQDPALPKYFNHGGIPKMCILIMAIGN
ncbi:hypothetical protein B0I35DRAFT_480101 [Stachybotrys elegans]|uniref:Uncharacterized protein n=1 Tax=Stachybotrys elegans TaxID=80388 RepID=A0A8K0WQS5_9HYPO|nr:hypothetical protein B0I35DRAFT_480101 [Stachybotrys elegans]